MEQGDRFEVMQSVMESIKTDHVVMLSPISHLLVKCTNDGIEEVEGFKELCLSDRLFVVGNILQCQESVGNKYRELQIKEAAMKANVPGSKLVAPSGNDKQVFGKK